MSQAAAIIPQPKTASDVENFLEKRSSRTTLIEIAAAAFQKIGGDLPKMTHPHMDNHDAGCVIQSFQFFQKILADAIFTNFITIIGNYDSNKDQLKSWENVTYSNIDEKNKVIAHLKKIRLRYAGARNNLVCHINDGLLNFNCDVPLTQIIEDINTLRDIFNKIRKANSLPIVISTIETHDHYPIAGLDIIFKALSQS